MSAHDQIRMMLDQLMGTSRNGEEEKLSVKFDDPHVCKSFLLGCCPHEILASTRMDMGECPKLHNLALRADYEKASSNKDYFYDLDAMEQLQGFISDADRKTEQAKKRLCETQEELSQEVSTKADKVHELAEKIGENLAKAETLGAEGFVDESIKLMEEIDNLRKLKVAAEADYRASIPSATYQQQKLRVCDVCCAFLGIHDNDRRLADHFGGKLHLGFIKIRDKLKEFQAAAEERRRRRREDGKRRIEVETSSFRRRDYEGDSGLDRERDRGRHSREVVLRDPERSRDRSGRHERRSRSRENRKRRSTRSPHSRSPNSISTKSHRSRDKRHRSDSKSKSRSLSRERKSRHSKMSPSRSRSRS